MNLTQHLLVGRAAARHMIDDGVPGALAMVTSVSGLYGAPNHAAYGAAKAGATNLARTMANEWGPYNIRVNWVAPDIIATPRVVEGFHQGGRTDIDALAADDGVPLARFGRPEEIAGPTRVPDLGPRLVHLGPEHRRRRWHAGPLPARWCEGVRLVT